MKLLYRGECSKCSRTQLTPCAGLAPTTLRLTARHLHFSGLLIIAIYRLISATCGGSSSQQNCGDYPQLPTILNQSPHKIPHSELRTNFRLRSSRLDTISNTDRLRLMRSYSMAGALPRVCLGVVRRDYSSQSPHSVPQGARMRWESLLQPGASPGTGAGRRHRARILQARPSSDRGQRGCREPQRSRIQALPYLPARSMAKLAETTLFPSQRWEAETRIIPPLRYPSNGILPSLSGRALEPSPGKRAGPDGRSCCFIRSLFHCNDQRVIAPLLHQSQPSLDEQAPACQSALQPVASQSS